MSTKPNQGGHYRRVPKYLREMREGADLTQRQLAAKVKRPQWWVARIETGSRRVDIAEFVIWCQGCKVDPAQVLSQWYRH